jgi:hypothetical protein
MALKKDNSKRKLDFMDESDSMSSSKDLEKCAFIPMNLMLVYPLLELNVQS